MAWRMAGTYYAPCSCKVSCPCELGEMEADQGWCSGSIAFDIEKGDVEGEDISGSRVVLIGDWPKAFLAGDGIGRLYFDRGVSPKKRAALEKVFSGKMGGVWEPVGALVPKWLPSKEAAIKIRKDGETTHIDVEGFGELVSTPLKGATGEPTRLLHGAATFRDEIILARGTGSSWRDPEMRAWKSGGHSEECAFDWSA
jgi:hypothetical protein